MDLDATSIPVFPPSRHYRQSNIGRRIRDVLTGEETVIKSVSRYYFTTAPLPSDEPGSVDRGYFWNREFDVWMFTNEH